MKQTLKILAVIFLFSLSVFAQQNTEWQQPVQKLRQRIQFLEGIAQRYHAQKAITTLQKASEDLRTAVSQFKHFQYVQAWINFNKAKQMVDLVERSVFFKPAAKAFMDAERLIRQAERLLQDNAANKDAQYMLNRARSFLQDAEKAYRNGQFVRGQELQRIAIFFATKAIALVQGTATPASGQFNFEEQLRNLRSLYQSVQTQAEASPQIQKLLKNAADFLKQAGVLYRQGKYQQALVQLQIGERLLYRAIDLSQQTEQGQKARVENDLQSLSRYINSIEAGLQGNVRAARLLRKARQFLRAARRDASQGNFQAAAGAIDLSQRMANRALRFVAKKGDNNLSNFNDRLKEVQHLYDSLNRSAALTQDAYTEYFKQRAQQLIKQAQTANQKGRGQLALAELNLAVRILNRLITHKASSDYSPQQIQDLQLKYQRLSRVLERLNGRGRIDVFKRELRQAGKQLQEKQYQIAETILDLLQKEVNALIRRSQNR